MIDKSSANAEPKASLLAELGEANVPERLVHALFNWRDLLFLDKRRAKQNGVCTMLACVFKLIT